MYKILRLKYYSIGSAGAEGRPRYLAEWESGIHEGISVHA